MKNADKYQWLFLVFVWVLFFTWEFFIQSHPKDGYEVRYDLLVLPILIVMTGYILFIQLKYYRKNRKQ